ncbi:saccharopine dehydrogenase NADP-binding domain-containing protein [Pseudaquabacterium rugosum]|uniref:Saccharopine dehydrogenase NADP-binding domain-containing protein n=1 Tax=Pseudaquabacterium rugosum TaxID=2984194 RepID=A0ABU9BEY2_9BURK
MPTPRPRIEPRPPSMHGPSAPPPPDRDPAPRVLVVGGYGAVGSGIVRTLLRDSRCRIGVVGRRLAQAEAFCQPLGPRVRAVALDADGRLAPATLAEGAAVLVNGVEALSPGLAAQCRAAGIHYVDVSATAEVLQAVQAQWTAAAPGTGTPGAAHSCAVLSVGVAPGLSHLLVREACERLGPLRHADITVLLGAGEVHGLAAIGWTLARLGRPYTLHTGTGPHTVRGFGDARRVRLPAPLGRRRAWRFDFSDQHTLPRTLPLDSAATWLCLDSRWVTALLAGLAWVRAPRWLPMAGLARLLAWSAARLPVGGTGFCVQVEALGAAGQRAAWALGGDGEAACTAAVAARVARLLLDGRLPPGVHHLEQVLTLAELLHDGAPATLRRLPVQP